MTGAAAAKRISGSSGISGFVEAHGEVASERLDQPGTETRNAHDTKDQLPENADSVIVELHSAPGRGFAFFALFLQSFGGEW